MGTIKDRGFASCTPARRQELARLGGRAAQSKGVAHRWTAEEAAAAGRKGGQVTREERARRQRAREASHVEE